MMWFVRLALVRPYTFIVMAILIMILGVVTLFRMSTDIFPEIDIPVVSIVWTYTGISPNDMEKRIVTISERAMTTTVNDIEHMESQSMNGVSIIKVFFHPGARVEAAVAQITSVSQSVIRVLPPGITPPLIIRYNASSVPILQVGINSKVLSEQALFDYGLNFIRTQLATVQGASVPLPLGGKPRNIMVDIDPQALNAKGLTATDVVNAINLQNLILPAGTAKIGVREYQVALNSSPDAVAAMNNFPIKQVNGATIYVRDVAQVRDGFGIQTNIIRQDGRRGTLLTVLKAAGASTLDVVDRVKKAIPAIQATLPRTLNMNYLFDQSRFVRASIDGVIREAIIASCLTATMILIFLGSWRSTLIVIVSIPLSILCSIICLQLCGQNINVMTLGGLALAIGMLVDDATVEIENIHRNQHIHPDETIQQIILDGAQQVATPALVSTLSICIVFSPVVLITGAAKSLFTPMAMAVVFAMLASYVLSRTLVPVLAMYLIPHRPHADLQSPPNSPTEIPKDIYTTEIGSLKKKGLSGLFTRFILAFERGFDHLRDTYHHDLNWALRNRPIILILFLLFCGGSFLLFPWIGQDFFPPVDAGQIRLHVRAPVGTRIEETERYFSKVETVIRQVIPPAELGSILDNIGLPNSGINLAFSDNATVGPGDGEILVALKEKHGSTWDYMKRLRQAIQSQLPELLTFYQPADIVSQILNFGLPAPIDIQVSGRNINANMAIVRKIQAQVSRIPGAVDVHIHQILNQPQLDINVDRLRASEMGLTQQDIASNLLISLSSNSQVAPNYWLNPVNGVNYQVLVQTPQYMIHSIPDIQSSPLSPRASASTGDNAGGLALATLNNPQLLTNVSVVKRDITTQVINHYNVQPTLDIFANVQDRDLGGVAQDIHQVLARFEKHLPRGTSMTVRGQAESMGSSFASLGAGLILAIVLVYLLMVVNFQSWIDPLIIMMGTPVALSGILWMLFATGTTFSVPSLMGAIMCIGVATANSILVVSFANDQRAVGRNAVQAASLAGYTRLRPVIMTALAMILGMLPMALGMGEGGEQNAPLGRAVIGGLLAATFATLFLIPILYSLFRKNYQSSFLLDKSPMT